MPSFPSLEARHCNFVTPFETVYEERLRISVRFAQELVERQMIDRGA
jgi:hypothetical protein